MQSKECKAKIVKYPRDSEVWGSGRWGRGTCVHILVNIHCAIVEYFGKREKDLAARSGPNAHLSSEHEWGGAIQEHISSSNLQRLIKLGTKAFRYDFC